MRVVLDTNVFLSALISSSGPPAKIQTAWRAGIFDLVTSVHQIDELKRVSRTPKRGLVLRPNLVGTLVNYLRTAIVLERLPQAPDLDDPNDRFLLAMVMASGADYLVTGDRRAGLLQLGNFGRTRIVTPSVFCTEVLR